VRHAEAAVAMVTRVGCQGEVCGAGGGCQGDE